jgi:tetratricopeptide (TPR) repeat protein
VDARVGAGLIAEYARRYRARAAAWGRIVAMTSEGRNGFPGEVSYGAAKVALESYVKSDALELGRFGVTANVVHPPATDTGWLTQEVARAVIASSPLRHVGRPEQVAEVVVYLASEQARFVTGNGPAHALTCGCRGRRSRSRRYPVAMHWAGLSRATACVAAACAVLLAGGAALSDQNDPRLGGLFRRLADAGSAAEAASIEQEIWAIWLACGDASVDAAMDGALRALNAGEHTRALRAFDGIVKQAPGFAEGWNKRATLRFLLGEIEASVRDIERTLLLEPRHFGALSGLAMIRERQGRPFEALEALERVVRLHPRLPHLQQRIDRLTRQLGDPV